MFEQTLLAAGPATRKNGAIFASLTAQIAICGVLAIAPLLYTQALPVLDRISIDRFAAPPPPPAPPPVQRTAPTAARPAPRTFQPVLTAPRAIPQRAATIVDQQAPQLIPLIGVPGGIRLIEMGADMVALPAIAIPPTPVAVPEPEPEPEPISAGPIAVSGGVQAGLLLERVVPQYPALARQMRVNGAVEMLAIIGVDGRVKSIQVLGGHPLLTQAAVDAVRQWIYRPTVLSGRPVEVQAPIQVNFQLQ